MSQDPNNNLFDDNPPPPPPGNQPNQPYGGAQSYQNSPSRWSHILSLYPTPSAQKQPHLDYHRGRRRGFIVLLLPWSGCLLCLSEWRPVDSALYLIGSGANRAAVTSDGLPQANLQA